MSYDYQHELDCDYPDEPDGDDDGSCPFCGATSCDECDDDCPGPEDLDDWL